MQNSQGATDLLAETASPARRGRRRRVWPVLAAALILLAASGAVFLWRAGRRSGQVHGPTTFQVRRGPLRFSVSETGTLQAERMERIRSRVQQMVSILYIVPEGTYITEEDVRQGKVLVELDSSELQERYTRQQITVESAAAALTKAKEDYQIQLNQNESNIRAAELNLKFARMALESYVGEKLAGQLTPGSDFSRLGYHPDLGGSALQRKIQLESNVRLAEEEVQRAKDKVEWTRRLLEKKYVTANELAADELALKRRQAELEQSKLALELFLRYELPEQVERRVADCHERRLAVERARGEAASEEAQARARLKSAESTYRLETEQLEKLRKQIDYATIRATRPGLVVYASSTDPWRRSSNPIEEGASVRERQEIIHLPDLSSMVAELKVHESVIEQIRPGQKAIITVDALPDVRLQGTVKEVANLPDPQRWLQDVKVYTTRVAIEGTHPSLRPGMSCRADITIAELEDALYVPVQAVTARGEQKVCYVQTPSGPQVRAVQVGLFDDKFVEIRSGLREGEPVLLNPPLTPPSEEHVPPPAQAAVATATGGEAGQTGGQAGAAAQPAGETPASGGRADFMRRMQAAGITPQDLQRWRTSGLGPEDMKKLRAAGFTEEQIGLIVSRSRSGAQTRRPDPEP